MTQSQTKTRQAMPPPRGAAVPQGGTRAPKAGRRVVPAARIAAPAGTRRWATTGEPSTRRVSRSPAARPSAPRPTVSASRSRRQPVSPPPPPRLGNPLRRMRFGLAVALLLFALLGSKLVMLQLSGGRAYAATAAEDRMAHVSLNAPRGTILDRSGAPLARSVPGSAIYADPKYVDDPVATAAVLSPMLEVPMEELVAKLSHATTKGGKELRFEYLARELDTEVGTAVQQLVENNKLAGIGVLTEERRDVPSRDIASNVVGFTGRDGDGLAGLEASYNDILQGRDGKRSFEVGLRGQEIPTGFNKKQPARPGADLTLTLDRDLQYETQRVLSEKLASVGATSGSAIVMDVSGEVLAMSSYPSYDASDPGSSQPSERSNVSSSMVLEPGSVHKAITLSAALEEGVIAPDTALTLPGTIKKGDKVFRDTHSHTAGRITLAGIMAKSSNIGTIMIADKLGADKLYEYQKRFGLGKKTNIGLAAESGGIVQPPGRWSGPSYGGIPIGIGVGVTPLQMTAAYATIAGDGMSVTPKLIKQIRGADGKEAKAPNTDVKSRRVISAENARVIREAMLPVVSKEGTAPNAAVSGYDVAGKTGTGLRVVNSKYAPGDVTSFIGMVPAGKPRYVISVFAHVPSGSGGSVAAPVFSSLASFALRLGGVAPTNAPMQYGPLMVP
ncbi:MAG: peptidoglycan D,D-transpeptidase FtsI family protein [Mycobacteriales bacterium]